jgi:hypothetical protein
MKLAIDGARQIRTQRVRTIVDAAIRVLEDYDAQGFSATLRALFYRLISKGVLINRTKDYRNLGRYINAAKESGEIDWDWVEDRTRFVRVRQRYSTTAEVLESAKDDWDTDGADFWIGQPARPELWIEKDALLSIIAPVCREFDVPYYSLRGWGRPSDKMEAARRYSAYAESGQRSVILHAGDHDPTGLSATENIKTQLAKYMRKLAGEQFVSVNRIALNMEQIESLHLAPNKIGEDGDKNQESRWDGYVQKTGTRDTWELDALEPSVLQGILRDEIQKYIADKPAWRRQQKLKRDVAAELQELIEGAA